MGDGDARLILLTPAALQESLADLERQRQEALIRLATLDGAIQATRHWLARLDGRPAAPEESAED